MSDPGSISTENTSSSKKKVSPARNVIGLVVLLVVIVAGFFQYSAVLAYNRAVKDLDARSQDEDKGLMQVPEVESLVGKSPDGPGSDFEDSNRTFTKTKYTWRGPLKSYTLTVYYTKGQGPCLHHFEPDGATYVPEAVAPKNEVISTGPATQKASGKQGRPMSPGGVASKTKGSASGNKTAPGPAAETAKPDSTADPAPAKAADAAAETAKPANTSSPVPAKQPE